MIAIDWFGPYSLEEAFEATKDVHWPGLYMCLGMTPYQRATHVQYVGIGKNIRTRLKTDHHKLQKVSRRRQLWLGEVSTAEPSGKKLKVTAATLDYAEWLHARFMQCKRVAEAVQGL
jgi:hypothetical protein